jgi:hypothetical protein
MIWALVAVSVVELCVVHLPVALLWSGWAALALSLVALAGMAWLIALIRSFQARPVELRVDRLRLQAGRLTAIDLSRADIIGLRAGFTGADVKAPTTLKLSLLAYPNLLMDLAAPVQVGRRRVTAVAHRLDDAGAFAQAFEVWRSAA